MVLPLSLSIDMDGLAEYAAIHGLPQPDTAREWMYQKPLQRFLDLADQLGAKATFFIIARDLQDAPRQEAIAQTLLNLKNQGHDIACHSFAHDYGMSLKDKDAVAADLERAATHFKDVLGFAPKGFRAPGYNISNAMLRVLRDQGYDYDASVFPCPPYYLAKALVLLSYRLRGKKSRAIFGDPKVLWAPRVPFVPGDSPYGRARSPAKDGPEDNLVALPLTVSGPLRLPLSAGILALLSKRWLRLLLRPAPAQGAIFGFHAMDFVDPDKDDIPKEIAARQPELRVSLKERQERFRLAIEKVRAGTEPHWCTLAERAALFRETELT